MSAKGPEKDEDGLARPVYTHACRARDIGPYGFLDPDYDDASFVRQFGGPRAVDPDGPALNEAYAVPAGDLVRLWLEGEAGWKPEDLHRHWECPEAAVRMLLAASDPVRWETRGEVALVLANRLELSKNALYFALSSGLSLYRLRLAFKRGELKIVSPTRKARP